jgi:hypothetical protein
MEGVRFSREPLIFSFHRVYIDAGTQQSGYQFFFTREEIGLSTTLARYRNLVPMKEMSEALRLISAPRLFTELYLRAEYRTFGESGVWDIMLCRWFNVFRRLEGM